MLDAGLASSESPYLFYMERGLLDASASNLLDGMFYMSVFTIDKNVTYIRYFEYGVLKGFFPAASEMINKKTMVVPWKVFTESDICDNQSRYEEKLLCKRRRKPDGIGMNMCK